MNNTQDQLGFYTLVCAPSYSFLTPSADNAIHLLLWLVSVNFAINERRVNLDWDCAGCFGPPWSHKKFCKTVNLPIDMDPFKRFQILGIVYVFKWELCK